jgi:hypothetical protein
VESDLAECEKAHVCHSSFYAERGLLYQTRPRYTPRGRQDIGSPGD